MTRPRIVVAGSSNTDMIVRMPRLPKPGETLLGGKFLTAAGGKGANQAVAAARAGGAVSFIARVGRDIFGDQAAAQFAREGMDTTHLLRDKAAPSGVALIFVGADGENCIGVAPGANASLSPADLRKATPTIAGASILLLQLETPLDTVEAAAALAAKLNVRVILNPAPACKLPARLLGLVSVLTPNEREAELLSGVKVGDAKSAANAAEKLRTKGVKTVIVTLGKRGALIADADGARLSPAFPVKAVDTTAGGDTFNGALAVALAEGKPIDDAVRFANAAAAISVTRLGAQPSAPKRREILKLLKSRPHAA